MPAPKIVISAMPDGRVNVEWTDVNDETFEALIAGAREAYRDHVARREAQQKGATN